MGSLEKRSMRHRHLTSDAGLSLPAIDDILDRGAPDDWAALARDILRDPHGAVADKVLHLCLHHDMYGTSPLWTTFVERARNGRLRGP